MENSGITYFQDQLKKYADLLTGDDSTFLEMRNAANDLHKLFVEAGGINAFGDDGPGTFSTFGLAVSPVAAGRCLLEFMRSRKFARGLRLALQQKLAKTNKKPVTVLYAGSGPYALLAVLMTPYFTPGQVQFTLIDIHSDSIKSATEIITKFGLADYFKDIILGDAIKFKVSENNKPDVLLLEAMLNTLRKEPQVTIAANLAPQLADDGIMIPEEITVQPVFTEIFIRNAKMLGQDISNFTQPAFHLLKPVAELTKASAGAIENIRKPFAPVTIKLEEDFLLPNYVLELQTVIKVWDDELLQLFDCSLSMPLKVGEGDTLFGKEQMTFTYNNGPVPGFVWQAD